MDRRLRLVAGSIGTALLASACGGGANPPAGGGNGSNGDAEMTVAIESPADSAEVGRTFTLEFSSSEPLGPPESGDFHVHVFYDGNEDTYEVVPTDSFEVKGLSPGEHTVTASLRNADHSPAGVEDEITVVVGGAAAKDAKGGDSGSEDDSDDGGGYDY